MTSTGFRVLMAAAVLAALVVLPAASGAKGRAPVSDENESRHESGELGQQRGKREPAAVPTSNKNLSHRFSPGCPVCCYARLPATCKLFCGKLCGRRYVRYVKDRYGIDV